VSCPATAATWKHRLCCNFEWLTELGRGQARIAISGSQIEELLDESDLTQDIIPAHPSNLPVWSKYSCGAPLIFEQTPEALTTLDRAGSQVLVFRSYLGRAAGCLFLDGFFRCDTSHNRTRQLWPAKTRFESHAATFSSQYSWCNPPSTALLRRTCPAGR
jgi:hypothetical protein